MTQALIARFSGEPVLACASKAEAFSSLLHTAGTHPDFMKLTAGGESASIDDDDFWPDQDSWLASFRPYTVKDGILSIPVEGALVKGFPYTFYGMITGYEYIRKAFDRGMDDPEVKAIVLHINSPGGEVAGNFDLADHMHARRSEKPVAAIADEHAYSAAYSLASVANPIYVARTGGVGSIGVVTSHVNVSKMLEKIGYEITFIYAGDHKVDGNPYEALSPEVKARIQERIDYLYNVFVSTVARNRGLDEQVVRGTQALTYSADEAIKIGLADKVGSFEAAMGDFSTFINPQGVHMSAPQEKTTGTFAQSDLDAARAEGMAHGAKAERERIKAIQTSAEAADRSALANHLAFNTAMSAEEAVALLGVSAKEVKPAESAASPTPFEAAMAKGNPELGAGAETPAQGEKDSASTILADFKAAGGHVVTKQ